MTGRPEITPPPIHSKTEWKTATEETPPPNNKPQPETEGTANRKQNGTHLNQTNGRTDNHQRKNQKRNRHKNTQHRLKREDHQSHQNHTKNNPKINKQTTTNNNLQAHKNYIPKIIENKKHTCGIEMHLWTTVHVYE